jgi:hypothetical protein
LFLPLLQDSSREPNISSRRQEPKNNGLIRDNNVNKVERKKKKKICMEIKIKRKNKKMRASSR